MTMDPAEKKSMIELMTLLEDLYFFSHNALANPDYLEPDWSDKRLLAKKEKKEKALKWEKEREDRKNAGFPDEIEVCGEEWLDALKEEMGPPEHTEIETKINILERNAISEFENLKSRAAYSCVKTVNKMKFIHSTHQLLNKKRKLYMPTPVPSSLERRVLQLFEHPETLFSVNPHMRNLLTNSKIKFKLNSLKKLSIYDYAPMLTTGKTLSSSFFETTLEQIIKNPYLQKICPKLTIEQLHTEVIYDLAHNWLTQLLVFTYYTISNNGKNPLKDQLEFSTQVTPVNFLDTTFEYSEQENQHLSSLTQTIQEDIKIYQQLIDFLPTSNKQDDYLLSEFKNLKNIHEKIIERLMFIGFTKYNSLQLAKVLIEPEIIKRAVQARKKEIVENVLTNQSSAAYNHNNIWEKIFSNTKTKNTVRRSRILPEDKKPLEYIIDTVNILCKEEKNISQPNDLLDTAVLLQRSKEDIILHKNEEYYYWIKARLQSDTFFVTTDSVSTQLYYDSSIEEQDLIKQLLIRFNYRELEINNLLNPIQEYAEELLTHPLIVADLDGLKRVTFYRKGSNGTIFKGKLAGEDVCIKIYDPSMHGFDGAVLKQQREALLSELGGELAAIPQLKIAGILSLDKFTSRTQLPFVITKYVGNRSLSEEQVLDDKDVPIFLDQTSRALHSLHKLGYVHKDLHAGNIRVSDPDQYHTKKRYHMLDAEGASKIGTPDNNYALTKTTGCRHTVAPELLERKLDGTVGIKPYIVEASLDVYGLGVAAYYAATGYYPHSETYHELSREQIQEKIYNNAPITKINVVREKKGLTPIAPQLEQLIHQMMGPLEQRPTMKTVQEQVKGMQ